MIMKLFNYCFGKFLLLNGLFQEANHKFNTALFLCSVVLLLNVIIHGYQKEKLRRSTILSIIVPLSYFCRSLEYTHNGPDRSWLQSQWHGIISAAKGLSIIQSRILFVQGDQEKLWYLQSLSRFQFIHVHCKSPFHKSILFKCSWIVLQSSRIIKCQRKIKIRMLQLFFYSGRN